MDLKGNGEVGGMWNLWERDVLGWVGTWIPEFDGKIGKVGGQKGQWKVQEKFLIMCQQYMDQRYKVNLHWLIMDLD